jgi:hypothetical protein
VVQNFEAGSEEIYGVPGDPPCMIDVRPYSSTISVLVAGDMSKPRIQGLRNIAHTFRNRDGTQWSTLEIKITHSVHDCYLFACRVIDQIQLNNEKLDEAVESVLGGWRDILRREVALSREQEIGLIGELLVVRSLIHQFGPETSIRSWIGPTGEEHDFGLSQLDIEVKTTASETRTHWISNPDQLRAISGRELRLISIMLTPRYGNGSFNLPELTRSIESLAGASRAEFMKRLEAVGYHPDDADMYTTYWMFRDQVLEYAVDQDFPKITGIELDRIGISSRQVPDLRYRLSMVGLTPVSPSVNFESFTTVAESFG